MRIFQYTLLSDGSSDKALMNIINWTLHQLSPDLSINGQYAELRRLKNPPKSLDLKIQKTVELYPCDVLFVHRDCESKDQSTFEARLNEITDAFNKNNAIGHNNLVRIVPIVMMETWLLIDEIAIKTAAGNRNYNESLGLPRTQSLESLPDSKNVLHDILKQASGRKGRRLSKFNIHSAVHLVAEYIDDFSTLKNLKAYQYFENELKEVLSQINFADY
ncbi:MAG TPA: hypothetical protein PKC76_18655 [Saprospiraceae bacterium]|nr:hypothetical protein [Saprospiraceae bacterium]HMP26156.1 hypothetical protein [Saprospiraceae bacterium]